MIRRVTIAALINTASLILTAYYGAFAQSAGQENGSPVVSVCPQSMLTVQSQRSGANALTAMRAAMNLPRPYGAIIDPQDVSESFRKWLYGRYPSREVFSLDARLFYVCFPTLRGLYSLAQQQQQERQKEKARQEREEALAQAERNKPLNILHRYYTEYIYVKKCYDDRNGYLSVNISDKELESARSAVRNIEQKMLEADAHLDKDAIWEAANQDANKSRQRDRDSCQQSLHSLEEEYTTLVPNAKIIRKDF
jgi:hypothetical protein